VLWLSLVLLVILLALVKNVFGLVVIPIAGFVIYDFARYGTVTHQTMAAYGIAWLLLFSGVRTVLLHWPTKDTRPGERRPLEQLTKIVPESFAATWLVGAIFAVFLGGRLMM